MKTSCIYAIRNTVTGKSYVGSASDFSGRKKCHLSRLRKGNHHSVILQRSWNKYGEDCFRFEILERVECVRDRLVEREQFWIDALKAADGKSGYNIAPIARSALGVKHRPEATAKRLATLAARTPEQKAETARKLAEARLGYKHKPETLAKMRGQKRTDETKARIGAAHKGRTIPHEMRERIANTLRGRKTGPQSPETIAKRVAATRATKLAKAAQR